MSSRPCTGARSSAWNWLTLVFCHRFDSSLADMNRFSESRVGIVSPALSSLSYPRPRPR